MVLRKMLRNRWMVVCLLVGSILAVAMVSSIPVYTDGVLQRMLIRDLENYQISSGYFPGRYYIKAGIYSHYESGNRLKAYHYFNDKITGEMVEEIGLPVLAHTQNLTIDYLYALPEIQREEKPKKRFIKLEALSNLGDHITIVHGRMCSPEKVNGVYEVIVTEEAMRRLDLLLDEVYVVSDFTNNLKDSFKVKVVGVFTIKDKRDPYWFQGLWAYGESFIMDYSLLCRDFIENGCPLLAQVKWYYAFDYHKINLDNLQRVLKAYESQKRWFSKYRSVEFKMPAIPVLKKYSEREKQLKITLWVLQAPILLMLAFYVFMVSRLIVEHEKNEIAVLKSRGASGLQVFASYFVEGLILGGVSLLGGPPLGLFICTIIGASNGFLEFVNRTALPLALRPKAYLYSVWAVVFFIITMLIPVFVASRTTIVQHKQQKARDTKKALWERYFVDILLLVVAAYGLYSYQIRQKTLIVTGAKGTDIGIDPLLFIISTLFILGIGMVFLRIFPYIIRFIFWAGKKMWSPVLYASFVQVGRSGGRNKFLMLFIILTLATGIFNANAARTLNTNIEEKVRYATGADVTIKAYWESNKPDESLTGFMGIEGGQQEFSEFSKEPVIYQEPPFTPYTELDGVEAATKVFRRYDVTVQTADKWISNVYLMGIIPNEFGKIAWFRPDLLPYHWYEYLNLMAKDPRAVLLSRSFQEKYGLKPGDSIWITWEGQEGAEAIVYAFVDYWPTFNPHGEEGKKEANLVVANLPYIHAKMALEPYEVWLKKKPGATSEQIYRDIEKKQLKIEELQDASQQIIIKKNDPMLQGTNGALTLGFIVTMTISTIGFLIYWILSIKERVLQFGVLRAMGLSLGKIIGMLVCEQVMLSGTAIIMGIVIGGGASELFVPLLQLAYSATQQVPPFKVVACREDYVKVYIVLMTMLTASLVVLGMIISKIKIHQAIKLGEE